MILTYIFSKYKTQKLAFEIDIFQMKIQVVINFLTVMRRDCQREYLTLPNLTESIDWFLLDGKESR